jgi:glucose-1-phosphate thymidylyltransferase
MKGIILAGGLGTRLLPLTKITNKHLLPIYNKPMIFYPIQTLINAGIRDILIVTGGNNAGDFLKLIGNGKEFGLEHVNYTYQEGEGGIAQALGLAEFFADKDKIVVVLGDNIIEMNIKRQVEAFAKQKKGAKILLKKVHDPQRFGVPVFSKIAGERDSKRGGEEDNKIIKIEEKPKEPKSEYAVTGIYMYDSRVFDIIKTLKPSGRGELEITDVNNDYIEKGEMTWDILDGWWTDAGTFESLLSASKMAAETGANKME